MTEPPARTDSLAYAFQEVMTAILRVRFQRQQVLDAESFRAHIRGSLQNAMQAARARGYSSEMIRMAVFATVAFLDESVLNLQSPVFADWSRRPLQEELFGGHTAGEAFFRNYRDLIGRQDSADVAEGLELHSLCLLLGYRGRYAFGDSGELHQLLRHAREKIARIRGNARPLASSPAVEVHLASRPDRWGRVLMFAFAALAIAAIIAFTGFQGILGSGAAQIQHTSLSFH